MFLPTTALKIFRFLIFSLLLALIVLPTKEVQAQDFNGAEKQFWAMALFNFRLNDRWVYGQDFAYQHSYKTPTFTRFFLRSQISRQVTGSFSAHGGLIFLYKFTEINNNALELRPWVGAKLRWPYFWRFNFVQYLRFEQRFQHVEATNSWQNDFRVRYKIGTDVPINRASLVDRTLYGILAYEFFSVSFGDDIRFTTTSTHRVDVGLGFRQNVKNRYEAVLLFLNGANETYDNYQLSSVVFFLRYKRFINWE